MVLSGSGFVFADDAQLKPKDNPPDTLFGNRDYSFSGYGAPFYKYSKAGDKYGSYMGARGGFIINSSFVIGGGGYGLVYPSRRDDMTSAVYTDNNKSARMGNGGGLLEYYFSPKRLINFSLGAMIGGGALTFRDNGMRSGNRQNTRHDNFFSAEPELNIHLNVTRFFRIGAGVSYRYVKGIDSYSLTDKDFRGFAGNVILAFGWF